MNLETLRHSTSHILAAAVKELWPGTKLGIGPAIENGFYYDFDKEEPFTDEDLGKIEKKMREIIARGEKFIREELPRKEAAALFKKLNEIYKLELIEEIPDEKIFVYRTGTFTDLCRGPHLGSSSEIKVFKLTSVCGAYWRGSERNPMLQRIYGTAFPTEKELNGYLELIEEAKKRDHRKLGKELELFSMHDEVGAGLVLYHPKGAILRSIIEDYEKKQHTRRGYQLVIGPHILKSDIWKRSGHYEFYKKNMYFFKAQDSEFAIKPMNCPGHMLVYKSKIRSYRDLPLRFFELGTVYRNEKSGVLHGLLRVRGFTQDDAHLFCREDQLTSEIDGIIDFVMATMKDFGFSEYAVELSTRPKDSIGTDADWKRAQEALESVLKARGMKFATNIGEGAFYGPKIDIKLKDALGREWQCATIQCDFALPERFDLTYTEKDGKEKRPIMLHRVLLGSMERFIGALIEHYGGAFPVWLAPVQVKLIPIADRHIEYAEALRQRLVGDDIRAEVDGRPEKMNAKIRDAELAKIPYMFIVGDKEEQSKTISVRSKSKGDLGIKTPDEMIAAITEEAGHYR